MSGLTGPPYPPNPVAGSNAVGSFTIGVSPIGDISTFNVWATIIRQYANSPILTGIIQSFNAAIDQTENLDNFYDLIWNVLTAQGYGLDLWGRIVNVSRTLAIPVVGTGPTFGFNEPGNDWTGFNQGPFATGGSLTQNVVLSDAQFRPLVLAKAASNICDGGITAINSILLGLFQGRTGECYVADGLNMSLTYTFGFALQPIDIAIIQNSGVLPNPCGVVVNIASSP